MGNQMRGSQRVQKKLREARASKSSASTSKQTQVAAYLRVSTEGQFSDGYGLDVQERACRAFALSQGFAVVDVISDCTSGASAPVDREGFKRVIELARAGAFTTLLVYRF